MYGLYGLKHHTVEMLPCGTDGRTDGRTNDKQGKIMLLSLWMLEGWVSQYIYIYRVFCRLSRVAVEYRKYRVNKKYRSGVTVRDIQYIEYVKYIKYTSNIQNISNILYFFKSVLGVNSRSAVSCVTLSYVELLSCPELQRWYCNIGLSENWDLAWPALT